MSLRMDVDGFDVYLNIKDYEKPDEDGISHWCKCDYSFSFKDWFHYHHQDDEVLLSGDVLLLHQAFSDLLADEISEPVKFRFAEPDFVFELFPKYDLRKDPNIRVEPGERIQDIYVEWRVYLWNEGLTQNFFTLTLYREEIIQLRDYFASVVG